MADPKPTAGGTIFHVLHGESPFMYAVDRRMALAHHPHEWKDRPWTEKEIEAYKKRQTKAAGKPEADE